MKLSVTNNAKINSIANSVEKLANSFDVLKPSVNAADLLGGWEWGSGWPYSSSISVWPYYRSTFSKTVNGDICTFSVDVPGVRPEAVQLEIKEGNLTFTGNRPDSSSLVHHSIYVDDNWDLDSAEAELEYGVLVVKFKRKPDRKTRSIKLNVK